MGGIKIPAFVSVQMSSLNVICTSPRLSNPAIIRNNVLFPLPLGPKRAVMPEREIASSKSIVCPSNGNFARRFKDLADMYSVPSVKGVNCHQHDKREDH